MKLNKIKQRLQHFSVNISGIWSKQNRNIYFKMHSRLSCSASPLLSLWIEDSCADSEWKFSSGFLHCWYFIYDIFILHLVWIEQVYSKLYTVSYLEIKIPIYSKPIYLMKILILTESTYCLFANIAHLITATDNLIWCSVIEDKRFKGITNIFTNWMWV